MTIRSSAVEGRFYPADKNECLNDIMQCISQATIFPKIDTPVIAGIVPHAGWFFSGAIAAEVFLATCSAGDTVDTYILLGACHSSFSTGFSVYDGVGWQTPLGIAEVNADIAKLIVDCHPMATFDNMPHEYEHSIEVQLPFIQHISNGARIVPVSVPPIFESIEFGESLAAIVSNYTCGRVVVIASTDLTHYGPSYRYQPAGEGDAGIDWSVNVNDKKFIDLAVSMDAELLLNHANEMRAACGGGAAAAVVAFAGKMGRGNGTLLTQTNSSRIMQERMKQKSSDSVGYASIIF